MLYYRNSLKFAENNGNLWGTFQPIASSTDDWNCTYNWLIFRILSPKKRNNRQKMMQKLLPLNMSSNEKTDETKNYK